MLSSSQLRPGHFRLRAVAVLCMGLAAFTVATARALPAAPEPAPPAAPETSTRWALVLSGGVARGFGHVGAIRALEQEGMRPDLVVGASMGGLIGALYASGYSSTEIQAISRRIDWPAIFGPRTDSYGWRDAVRPQTWVRLVGTKHGLRFPAGLVDDSALNFMLISLFIDADATSDGDFDRLPIRFRTVGTDLATARWVTISGGGLARAVRTTIGLPMVFAPMSDGRHLLLDGGMSANLPLDLARGAGADRLLAVDVALPTPKLDERTSGLAIAMQLFDMLNKRSQRDTLTARDTFVWLKLPGVSATDFAGADSIIERGYREARAPIHEFALRTGLPPAAAPALQPAPLMPRLARVIEWRGGPVVRARTARSVMRRLPTGEFQPHDLLPALSRLRRSGLFESQWPSLERRGDSTVLVLDVREQPALVLSLAGAASYDEGSRLFAGLAFRPVSGPLPAVVRVDGALRKFGWAVNLSAEPYALDRGNTGWFVRGTQRVTETRVFAGGERVGLLDNERSEAMLGGQIVPSGLQVIQLGAGWGHVIGAGSDWSGPLVAVRTEAPGASHRLIEAEWALGARGYQRVNAWFDLDLKLGGFVVRPGARFAGVEGDVPVDAHVGLGGPPTLAGLHYDEWLGRRMGAVELRVAREFSSIFSLYVAGQGGVVDAPLSGVELGETARASFGAGAEVATPLGPLRLDFGHTSGGRERLDLMLGARF